MARLKPKVLNERYGHLLPQGYAESLMGMGMSTHCDNCGREFQHFTRRRLLYFTGHTGCLEVCRDYTACAKRRKARKEKGDAEMS